MAMRPQAHVLEEKSTRAFTAIIPPEWVVRRMDPDYGYDFQVQPFVNGSSTTLFFLVQIKATGTTRRANKTMTRRLATARLREFTTSPNPVMVVAHDAVTNKTYFEWVHDWLRQHNEPITGPLASGTKTLTLKRLLTRSTVTNDVLQEVKVHYRITAPSLAAPGPLRLALVAGDVSPETSVSVLLALHRWLGAAEDIAIVAQEPDAIFTVNDSNARATWAGRTEEWQIPPTTARDAAQHETHVLRSSQFLLLALTRGAGLRRSWQRLAQAMVNTMEVRELEGSASTFLLNLGWTLASDDRATDALFLAEELLRRGSSAAAGQVAASMLQHHDSGRLAPRGWEVLTQAISVTSDLQLRCLLRYNLATSLLDYGQARQAAKSFILAAADSPRLISSIWWIQLTNALLASDRRRLADHCSRYLIETNRNAANLTLHADTSVLLGQFRRAHTAMTEGLALRGDEEPLFVLKAWAYGECAAEYGEAVKRNRAKAQRLSAQSTAEHNPESGLRYLKEAIAADPLDLTANWMTAARFSLAHETQSFLRWLRIAVITGVALGKWIPIVVDLVEREHECSVDPNLVLACLRHVVGEPDSPFFDAAQSLLSSKFGREGSSHTMSRVAARYADAIRRFPNVRTTKGGALWRAANSAAFPDSPKRAESGEGPFVIAELR